jgi:hypothetical protein
MRRWVLGFVGAALVFRLAIVLGWHQSGGDGLQYFQLAQELRRAARFSYGADQPLSYSRLPGYPLFLAATVSPGHPLSLENHVFWAAIANVFLDIGTALLVFGILRRRGLGGARLALAMTLLCPTLWLVSSFAMTESLSTFLGTAALYLAIRALGQRPMIFAAAAGAAVGAALLVRADAITFVPGALLLLGSLPKRRLTAMAAFGAAALVVFAPWPIRNQLRFGAPHFFATGWRDMDGEPLGNGPFEWARTWSRSAPGDAWFEIVMANHSLMEPKRAGVMIPEMFDDDAEKQRLVALFWRYNSVKLTPEVDDKFRALAAERRAKHPFRYYVTLPLQRMTRLWSPVPDWETPMNLRWLGLPTLRPVMGWLDKPLFALALVGAIVAWRRGQRALVGAFAACLGARTLLYGWAIPHVTCGRYLVEAFPMLIALAAIALTQRAAGEQPREQRQAILPP